LLSSDSKAGQGESAKARRLPRRVRVGALLAGVACLSFYLAQVAEDAHMQTPAPTPILYDRNGTFLTQVGHESIGPEGARRTEFGYWTTEPPARVVQATLALEDRRFWSHPGVDPLAVLRALRQHLAGEHGSGASTIAMQVARMQHPRPRTLWAKAVEAGTALALVARYGHRAVLAQYLRLAPYGESSHGIGHAARWYFDRPAGDLTWAQAALLAAVPQAPALLDLRRPAGEARAARRAAGALATLANRGVLSAAERDQEAAGLLHPPLSPAPHRPAALQAVLRLQEMVRGGEVQPDPADPLLRATLDLRLQTDLAGLASAHLAAWRPAGAQQVAVMVVRRPGREVLADIASAGYDSRPGGAIDFSAAPRSPGSTLKPFLYARALDAGLIQPADVLADLPENAPGISNADNAFLGPLLPRQALANSRNVPAANLLRRIGLEQGFGFLRELGLHGLDGPAERFGLAMAIGALPTSLDRLAGAYATLAGDGIAADLVWLDGQRRAAPRRLISADAARLVTRFLSDPMARLPSFPRYGASEFPFAVALKTGTSQGYRDAWTMAWSDQYLVGVWVGRADAGPMAQLSGARAAGRLAQAVMLRLHGVGRTDLRAGDFAAPPGREPAELCTGTGRRATAGCAGMLTEWIRPGEAAPAAPAVPVVPRLTILAPEPDTHLWRNPEAPRGLDRLVLRAGAEPKVAQIVWLVDGHPLAVAAPDEPVYWTLTPGRHSFQIRLPLQADVSHAVSVVVE
jgi:penicillin-binding protein 1C